MKVDRADQEETLAKLHPRKIQYTYSALDRHCLAELSQPFSNKAVKHRMVDCMRKSSGDFVIRKPPDADVGRWRIRFSRSDRLGADRHTLLKVTHNGRSGYFVGLGHEEGNGVVLADYDVREHLGLGKVNSNVRLDVELVTGWRVLCWYLQHRDPYVYVPAWVGAWSLIIGMIGVVLGLVGLWP